MSTLYRKYRPQTFADVTSQDHVTLTLQNQLTSGRVAHAYLFTGPRGVGKTTTARLIAKAVNCQARKGAEPCNSCSSCEEIVGGASLDVYEIDAASHTGVDNVRENIIESVRFAPNRLKFKVYIIDEVHMLSTSAFNALLKTLEEPPAHALFVLATTEIHKVPQTIVSRCQRFDFKRIPAAEMVTRLKGIAKEEEVKVDEEVLYAIARASEGCERDAESLLGQLLAMGEKKIGLEQASLVLPTAQVGAVIAFVDAISARDAAAGVRLLNEFAEQGMEMGVFLDAVISNLRTMLFVKLGGLERFADEYDDQTLKAMKEISERLEARTITEAIEAFADARRSVRTDAIPQLSAELAVMRVCDRDARPQAPAARATSTPPAARPAPPSAPVTPDFPKQEAVSSRPEPVIPEPIVPEATVFDSVPVISLEQVKKKWPEVFQQIQACNASLPLIMQSGQLSDVVGDVVEMRFEYALHVETLNRVKNKQIVEEIIARVLGKPVRLQAVHAPTQNPEEAVDTLLQEFGGQAI